jgi:hypothetical protein
VLLTVGLVASGTLAVVQTVRLADAQARIEELEEQVAETGDGGGGFLEELQQIFEDLLGEGSGELGGVGAGFGDLVQCLAGDGGLVGGETAPTDSGGTVEQQVASIADEVERIRELEFSEPVQPEFLSEQEAGARVRELFLEEYTAELADRESRILAALGAIPPGTDLRALRAETLGQQVAGFYDPETGELVVRTSGEELSPLDKVTLAHELEHALADQRLDLPVADDLRPGMEDADLAALAVVEGDATLTMQRFSQALPLDEQVGLIDPEAVAESEAGLAELPAYLEQELLFPYEQGLNFVCGQYAEGGWEAVNDAYATPPTTSAQVLFPERFRQGETAVDPRDPSSPGQAWHAAGTGQLGAANLLWLFSAPGDDPGRALSDPMARSSAWAGGEVRLWTRGPETALGIALAERTGSDDLCLSVQEWYGSAFQGDRETGTSGGGFQADGDRQDSVVTCSADEVRVGIGPDLATAGAVVR